jgi:hypothetical protein
MDLAKAGTANIRLASLYLNSNVIDTVITSTYLDGSLGTRPEDINIEGGAYVDTYSSHAPEELVPGRMYDCLDLRVFSNNSANTTTYGFRIFQPMSSNVVFKRITDENTTSLASNLAIGDSIIFVTDASKLPDGNPSAGTPGAVSINGEIIQYYQRYTLSDVLTAIPWAANTVYSVGTIANLNSNTYVVTGNVYANANAYVNTANLQQIYPNTITQLRRGTSGTGAPNIHATGTRVVDSSSQQNIPNSGVYYSDYVQFDKTVAANVTWRLGLSSNITANIGDYITQFVGNTGNARVLGNVTSANVVAVELITGNLIFATNIGTKVNLVTSLGYSTTSANVLTIQPLGQILPNANVILSSVTLFNSNVWVNYGTSLGLEGSTTAAAQFIRAKPSYTP